jgi:glucosamine 6-phosphate synthetase-like amidotransferase/phosphosugar isomerase protein
MCGLIGYVGKKQVGPVLLDGLRRLEYRGYDSAGGAVAGNGDGLQVRRAEGKLPNPGERHPAEAGEWHLWHCHCAAPGSLLVA